MNIFYLDSEVKKCAEYHVNSHIVKMPLETAQLLCSAHWNTGGEAPYKNTHRNHPCSLWARNSISNYMWLCELGFSLLDEYSFRYGKTHGCHKVITWCSENIPNLKEDGFTEPPLAMGDEFKVISFGKVNVIQSYRNYYLKAKNHLFQWKKRDIPDWVKEGE